MFRNIQISLKNIVAIFFVTMFFSCKNDTKEVRDFLAEKNLPIGIAKDAVHFYKDSGYITSKLETNLMYDFSNRENHPYSEFPEGLVITNYENKGKDSVKISGNYALSYKNTFLSEIRGNVVVTNYTDNSVLKTEQLFWDQKTNYFFSEKPFILQRSTDTIKGTGFESKEDLTKWISKKISGDITTQE